MSRIAKHTHYTQLEVHAPMPKGCTSPRNIVIWKNRIFASSFYEQLPAGKKKRFHDFVMAMLPWHQPQLHYIQITREKIATTIGCSLKTISRYFSLLIQEGFLALVAPGKSKEKSKLGINEAPVYAPCVQREGVDSSLNENFVHPFVNLSKNLNPFNARTRKNSSRRPQGCKDSDQKIKTLNPYQPVIAPEGTKKAQRALELQAAATLRERAIDLRELSLPHLASLCRRFFKAGWCVKDILQALEENPSGDKYTTNGAGGMRSKAAWLCLRLKAWLTDANTPLPSPVETASQKRGQELAQRAKERRQELARLAKSKPMPTVIKKRLQYQRLVRDRGIDFALKQYPEFATDK